MSSGRQSFVFSVFCVLAIGACDSKQATHQADKPSVPAAANDRAKAPAATLEAAKTAATPVDTFVLEAAAKATDTLQSLRLRYGEKNVSEEELPGAEGETSQGWMIYPNQAEKKLSIYLDDSGTHPGSLSVSGTGSLWHLANGIKLGTNTRTLEALNKKPFAFSGFYWDYGGVISDWHDGALEHVKGAAFISIGLCPPENAKLPEDYLSGDSTFDSNAPLALKYPPVVCELGMYFPQPE